MVVVENQPLTPILRLGRKRGSGCNMILLRKMRVGACIWHVAKGKMYSIKHSARALGIKIKVRKLPNGFYAIWKMDK